ncbi:MAG: glycosyltransferase family 39 protein [Patescibacteria group bacterium]
MSASVVGQKYVPYALLLVLFSLVAFFSLYRLSESPPTWYDEGMILQVAENIALHGVMGLQLAPGEFVSAAYISSGFPVTVPVAASFYLFGVNIVTARAVAVLFIFLLIATGICLLTRLQNRWYALAGGFFVATFSSLYGNGKNVLGEVPGLSFLLLFLLFLQKLEESDFKNIRYAIATGIFLGLTTVTKPLFLIVPVALCGTFLFHRRPLPSIGTIFPWFLGASSLPVILWLLTQFSLTDSIAGILSFYANPYHLTNLPDVMWKNFLRFFTEPTPLYTLGIIALWTLALVIRKLKRQAISYAEACAFFFTVLVMLSYLRTPGWYRYFFTADVVTLFFLPSAIGTVLAVLLSYIDKLKKYEHHLMVALVSLFVLLQCYYLVSHSWISRASQSELTSNLERDFGALDAKTRVFVFDVPAVVPFLQYDTYWQYFADGVIWTAGQEQLVQLENGVPDIVIMHPSKLTEAQPYLEQYTVVKEEYSYDILVRKVKTGK